MAGVTYPLEDIDRMEAIGQVDPMTAAKLRQQTMDQMSTPAMTPSPEGFEMVNPRTVSSQPEDVGSELIPPEQVTTEYVPEQVDPEIGYEMVNPRTVASIPMTAEEYDERMAAAMAEPTRGEAAESRVRGQAQDWYSDMSRRARGITGRGAAAIGRLGKERATGISAAGAEIGRVREEQWAAEERLAGVYEHRRELTQQSREWLTKREQRRAETERTAQADVELAMREKEYWNYEGTSGDLERDLRIAEATGPEGEAARERLQAGKAVDPRGGIFSEGWSTVLAALAMGMGAFGSAMAGGPNYAMQIINKAVDRNIKAQLEKKRGAREKLTDQERRFDKILSRFDDGTERQLIAKSMMLQEAAEQATMYAQQSATAEKRASAEQMAAALTDQSLAAQQEAWQRRTTISMQGWDAEYKMGHLKRQMAAAAAKSGQLRPTPSFMMEKFGAMRTVLSAIKRGREQFDKVRGVGGVLSGAISKATGNIWDSEAALYDANMVEIGQLVTKATQGARPSDRDMDFTLRRIPAFYENYDLGMKKIDAMERSVVHGLAGLIVEGLADGYDYRRHYNEFVETHGAAPEDVISGKAEQFAVDRSIFEPGTAKEAPPVVGGTKGAYLGSLAAGPLAPLGAVGGAVIGGGGPESFVAGAQERAGELGREISETWKHWGK